jgi:excisionase family DNA binding protein
MVSSRLSVNDAAKRLKLSPQRVRALIASGDLPAERIGARYVLDPSVVGSFLQRERFGGRPLSACNAWAVLAELSARPDAVPVSRRSRYRLRSLLESGGDVLVRALSAAEPRSREERWRVLASDLAELARSSQVVLSGLSADDPGIDVRYEAARDGLEGYVSQDALRGFERRLKPEKNPSHSNLLLRVPQGDAWILGEKRAPSAVVAADLLDHEDPRVRRSARAALIGVAHAD